MRAECNAYSPRWFEFFHIGIDEARTIQEATFVCRCAPLPDFRKLADVCCGMGRHARALSSRGYSVTGIDRDAHAIAKARELAGGPSYVQADIREYRPEPGMLDVAIVMSQSFGYFDPATNRNVLGRLAVGLREGGRVILDLWNHEFFAAHQGERELKTASGVVLETKRLNGDRLRVQLDYPDGAHEEFEWQLFSPAQMIALAQSVGLALLLSCTDFDITITPSHAKPRIQFVLERSVKE
jgi:SAM-dependent methyltransferase